MTNIKHKIKNPETKIKLDFYHLPAHCGMVRDPSWPGALGALKYLVDKVKNKLFL